MSELKKLLGSGRGATDLTVPVSGSLGAASTRTRASSPRATWSIIDSWTLTLTCMLAMSGRLKIFCRSRTVAPSSISGWVLPRKLLVSLA
jgi:hypothetical protein